MIIEPGPFYAVRSNQNDAAQLQALHDAIESGRASLVADAIGALARSRGMSDVARQAEMSRATLYKVLSDKGNPTLDTLMKVLAAMGLKLEVREAAFD
jgi:probable addiction module antidote protein